MAKEKKKIEDSPTSPADGQRTPRPYAGTLLLFATLFAVVLLMGVLIGLSVGKQANEQATQPSASESTPTATPPESTAETGLPPLEKNTQPLSPQEEPVTEPFDAKATVETELKIPEIVLNNEDVLPAVLASSNSGLHIAGVKNANKMFSMLVTTDIHADSTRLMRAISYLNHVESLDCGICLGDIQAVSYGEGDADWYADIVNQSGKPFYTVIGNHDGGVLISLLIRQGQKSR